MEEAITAAGYGPGDTVRWRWQVTGQSSEQPNDAAAWQQLPQPLPVDEGGRMRFVGPLLSLPNQVGRHELHLRLGDTAQRLQVQVLDITAPTLPAVDVAADGRLHLAALPQVAVQVRLPPAPTADARLQHWQDLPTATGPGQWWGWTGSWPQQRAMVPKSLRHVPVGDQPAQFLAAIMQCAPQDLPAQLFMSPDLRAIRHSQGSRTFAELLWAIRARYAACGYRGRLVLVLPPMPPTADAASAAAAARLLWRQRALHLGWTVVDSQEVLGDQAYVLPNGALAAEPIGPARQALAEVLAQVAAGPLPPARLTAIGGTRLLAPGQSGDIAWQANGPVLEGLWFVDDQLAFVDDATQHCCGGISLKFRPLPVACCVGRGVVLICTTRRIRRYIAANIR